MDKDSAHGQPAVRRRMQLEVNGYGCEIVAHDAGLLSAVPAASFLNATTDCHIMRMGSTTVHEGRGMIVEVTTYYLEMTDPHDLRPKRVEGDHLEVRRAELPSPEFSRFLYTAVGGEWYWTDRLSWTHQQWREWVDRPELETWVAYVSGTPAGYFEVEAQPQGSVEIVSFGLFPQFIGKGLGGHLLTVATERAWQMGASRVWVHTCTLDHAAALANYRARGFRVFREETQSKDLPDKPPGPWPGSQRTDP